LPLIDPSGCNTFFPHIRIFVTFEAMKKWFSLLMAGAMIRNIFGYYLVFRYNQYVIRREIAKTILSRKLDKACVIIKLPTRLHQRDITRHTGDEIWFGGMMYDILSVESLHGLQVLRCLADHQETNLLASFSRTFGHNENPPGASSARHCAAMLHHIISAALLESKIASQVPSVILRAFHELPRRLSAVTVPCVTPPPETTAQESSV